MSNILMKWLVIAASILWAAVVLDQAVLETGDFSSSPVAVAEKSCASEDMHQRYECTEAAILARQRAKFVRYIGVGLLLFGPPIGVWMGMERLARTSVTNLRPDRRTPPISKWRVR